MMAFDEWREGGLIAVLEGSSEGFVGDHIAFPKGAFPKGAFPKRAFRKGAFRKGAFRKGAFREGAGFRSPF